MPGIIHVLVLEAFDLPEAITDGEEVAVKVAIGAREFQTSPIRTFGGKTTPWSLDFVFPVLNLRDNLLVMLLHKNGDIISKNEIDTPSIVEKGSFEVDLLLNGGGNIHLSLSFVLTDEERRRIDIMRAAALKRREQEALKSTTNPQPVEKESQSWASNHLLSAPTGEPEKDLEESNELQSNRSDGNLQGTHEEPSTDCKPVGELDFTRQDSSDKTSTVGFISPQDPVKINQTAASQMNLNPAATTEIASQPCLYSGLEEQTPSEYGESLEESAEVNHDKPSPNSVKAKIQAFETARPKGSNKQSMTVPSTIEVHMSSPQFKSSPKGNVESEAEQAGLPKENFDLLETNRTDDENLDSQNQLGSVEPFESVSGSTLAASGASEKDFLHERELKQTESDLEPEASVVRVETNERDKQREKVLVTASKQKRRHINFDGVSKQVLNGAIVGAVSGAALIAAGVLLWARNPNNRRNGTARQQISKQRTRK